MRNSTLLLSLSFSELIFHIQNNFVKCRGIIYLFHNTQLCKLRPWHMSRFSVWFPRAVPWAVLAALTRNSCTESGPNPLQSWLFAFQKSTNPGKRSSAFPGLHSASGDQTWSLTGGQRPPQHGPWARGKHPPVASLSWQILKTWPSTLATSPCLYLLAILWNQPCALLSGFNIEQTKNALSWRLYRMHFLSLP